MSAPNDGGAAFPCEGGPESGLHPDPGMSLRDYFAGQALAGWLAVTDSPPPPEMAAKRCYSYADAMIAARGMPADDAEMRLLLGEALEVLRANDMGGTVLAERIRTVLR